MSLAAETLRRTPLHDRHERAGARLVPFAGWEMPVQYEGIRQEHLAVRTAAGVFDVSHMGEIETSGPDAEVFLQRVLSNDVSSIAPSGAQYSVLCREDGGVLDDLFTYRLDDRFLTVTNASNHERDYEWFRRHASGFDVTIRDRRDDYAMLALQGPNARALLAHHLNGEAPARMRAARVSVARVECLVCGTGYTGEQGVEILTSPSDAGRVWDALLADGVIPCGLGARDTLRIEVCYPLYGHELTEQRNPIAAGLGWCCKLDTDFIGSASLGAEPEEMLVPFALTDKGIPRAGNAVTTEAGAGVVTSGTFSPCLESGIGMAYVPAAAATAGTPVEVDVRGRVRHGEVRDRPLYRKGG